MTKREIELLIENRFQQLKLITETIKEFEEKDGIVGVQNRIDAILDELILYRKMHKNFQNDED